VRWSGKIRWHKDSPDHAESRPLFSPRQVTVSLSLSTKKRMVAINFQRLTREYIHEFFPNKLSLSHNREESSDGEDVSFRDDEEEFLTSIVNTDQGRVASLSLVSCLV